MKRHTVVAVACSLAVVTMTGAAFAAVPLYDLFCRVTGFDGTTAFERCMSSATVAIGQLERLDLADLDTHQRDRLNAAAARLQACIWEMNQ